MALDEMTKMTIDEMGIGEMTVDEMTIINWL
jgi:hypothetical protein